MVATEHLDFAQQTVGLYAKSQSHDPYKNMPKQTVSVNGNNIILWLIQEQHNHSFNTVSLILLADIPAGVRTQI